MFAICQIAVVVVLSFSVAGADSPLLGQHNRQALQRDFVMSKSDVKHILKGIIDAKVARAEKKVLWEDSDFQAIQKLQAVNRGDVAEEFIADVLAKGGYRVKFSSQVGKEDGDYDILVNDTIKLDVKTATLASSGKTFQHENIRQDGGYDILVLVDVAPNDLYVTVAPKQTLPFFEFNENWTAKPKVMHRRLGGSFYKWDFSLKDVKERKVESTRDILAMFELAFKRLDSCREILENSS